MIDDKKINILKEYISVYIERAGSLLSEMVGRRICLKVPEIILVKSDDNYCCLEVSTKLFEELEGHVMSTSIYFNDEFSGQAQLVFPAKKIKKLVALCMGEDESVTIENELEDFIDTDYDVIREIGNVILNSVVGGLSNLLGLKLNYSLPNINIYTDTAVMIEKANIASSVLLVIQMSFTVTDTNITGVLMNVLNLESVKMLDTKLQEMWDDLNG